MTTFVVAHGAWSAGWAWKRMRPRLRALGHEIFTPTYTGLGERVHLANREIGLNTHIQDVLGVLECEDLHDVVLLGHSYGGMVATGVADAAAGRLSQLVYLDAFVPRDGQSAFDLQNETARARMIDSAKTAGDGWLIAQNPMPPDTAPDDVEWARPRRFKQPFNTFNDRIKLTGAVERLPRTYIYCLKAGPGDNFRQFADRAKSEQGWRYRAIDASHNPHITVPDALTALLVGLV